MNYQDQKISKESTLFNEKYDEWGKKDIDGPTFNSGWRWPGTLSKD